MKSHLSISSSFKAVSESVPRLITGRPLVCIIFSLLLASIFVPYSFTVKTVDNVDYFTRENDPDVQFYDHFKEVFGNDEFFIIAFQPKAGITHSPSWCLGTSQKN